MEFKTSIFLSAEGFETRSSMRKFPRVSVRAEGVFANTFNSKMQHFLEVGNLISFPNLVSPHLGVFSDSSNRLSGPLDDFRFSNGKGVFLKKGKTLSHHIVEGSSKDGFSPNPLPADQGSHVVFPEIIGRLSDSLDFSNLTSAVSTASVSMQSDTDQTFFVDNLFRYKRPMYRNRPCVFWRPNFASPVRQQVSKRMTRTDLGYGVTKASPRDSSLGLATSYEVFAKGANQIREIMSFFCQVRGRQGSFFAPSWTDDFDIVSDIGEGDTSFYVRNEGQKEIFDRYTNFRNLCLLKSNQFSPIHIQEMVEEGDNLRVDLSDPVPEGFGQSSTAYWFVRQRMNSDRLTLEFLTTESCRFSMSVSTILDDLRTLKVSGNEVRIEGDWVTVNEPISNIQDTAVTIQEYPVALGQDYLTAEDL